MPTKRPRYPIPETEAVAGALAVARSRWPEDSEKPAALIQHLVAVGTEALLHEADERHRAEDEALAQAHAALQDAYPAGYLDDLRQDWPA